MEIKFRWVGLNKHFNEIQIQEDLTTEKILNGETFTFYKNNNRGDSGNCQFISEDLFSGLISEGRIYLPNNSSNGGSNKSKFALKIESLSKLLSSTLYKKILFLTQIIPFLLNLYLNFYFLFVYILHLFLFVFVVLSYFFVYLRQLYLIRLV